MLLSHIFHSPKAVSASSLFSGFVASQKTLKFSPKVPKEDSFSNIYPRGNYRFSFLNINSWKYLIQVHTWFDINTFKCFLNVGNAIKKKKHVHMTSQTKELGSDKE